MRASAVVRAVERGLRGVGSATSWTTSKLTACVPHRSFRRGGGGAGGPGNGRPLKRRNSDDGLAAAATAAEGMGAAADGGWEVVDEPAALGLEEQQQHQERKEGRPGSPPAAAAAAAEGGVASTSGNGREAGQWGRLGDWGWRVGSLTARGASTLGATTSAVAARSTSGLLSRVWGSSSSNELGSGSVAGQGGVEEQRGAGAPSARAEANGVASPIRSSSSLWKGGSEDALPLSTAAVAPPGQQAMGWEEEEEAAAESFEAAEVRLHWPSGVVSPPPVQAEQGQGTGGEEEEEEEAGEEVGRLSLGYQDAGAGVQVLLSLERRGGGEAGDALAGSLAEEAQLRWGELAQAVHAAEELEAQEGQAAADADTAVPSVFKPGSYGGATGAPNASPSARRKGADLQWRRQMYPAGRILHLVPARLVPGAPEHVAAAAATAGIGLAGAGTAAKGKAAAAPGSPPLAASPQRKHARTESDFSVSDLIAGEEGWAPRWHRTGSARAEELDRLLSCGGGGGEPDGLGSSAGAGGPEHVSSPTAGMSAAAVSAAAEPMLLLEGVPQEAYGRIKLCRWVA